MTDTAPPVAVSLDWRAYFLEFDRAHGGSPMAYGEDRYLYGDGWMYSSKNHEGPEFRPPDDPDELAKLIEVYFRRRLFLVAQERDELRRRIAFLDGLQKTKSAPLQEIREHWDNEAGEFGTGGWVQTRQQVNLDDLKMRLEWLDEDVSECEVKLRGLRS